MKKIQKKLVLKKRTIAQLSENAIDSKKLNNVNGGKTGFCASAAPICIVSCFCVLEEY